ncbi:protoporphyrinogen oxidase [Nocardioidaceae bacterium SCSIO 66511]|nr:protoporphyrinogen oxidase [Nocardioidaceae bacterium SCSIO 66511]
MSQPARPRIAVVGAGIAGAAAAEELSVLLPDAELLVLESSDRLGGKLHRVELAGATVDVGAESMLARRPEALDLATRVGLRDAIIHPVTTKAALWTRGSLRPLPPTVMGVPADVDALAESGVISRVGMIRAVVPRRRTPLTADVSVGDYVAAQLGDEVCDRLLEPLLGGVYAGHARSLSLLAAAPQIAALADRDGSLIEAAAQARREKPDPGGQVFAGLRGGVGQLAPAALESSGATVRRRATVRELRRSPRGWQLTVGPTTDVEVIDADAVVLATPAAPSARLLSGIAEAASTELASLEYASMAIVSLAVPRAAIDGLPHSSGFLVPPVDGRVIKAATLSSRKWGWVDEASGDLVVLRASVGRAGEAELLQRADDELVSLAVADLRAAVGLRGEPVDSHVQRWGGALPQYAVGHLDLVRRVEESIAAVPGLEVAGAAYSGVGIPAVIATARRAAERVANHLRSRTGARETMEP